MVVVVVVVVVMRFDHVLSPTHLVLRGLAHMASFLTNSQAHGLPTVAQPPLANLPR